MKILNVIFGILLLLLISCSKKDNNEASIVNEINSFSELEKLFNDPPADFRTVPFMVWNGKVTKEKIDGQLKDLHESGCGGVIIHPRYGLITEYIGNEWYDLVKYTVEKGKEFGMNVWLYDENPYPSGFAGGHVPVEMPESYLKEQGIVLHKTVEVTSKDKENYAYIFSKQENNYINITDSLSRYYNIKGDYYRFKWIYNYTERTNMFAGFGYVDLLMPGVTEKFMELTMHGYEETVGDEFGNVVLGIFTDEPNIAPPSINSIRYTPGLFELFYKEYGYYLEDNLPSLFEDVGQWKKIRYHYFKILLETFIERWSKPWYEYCENNNINWTGHYWEHGWPDPMHGGDNMAMYAWHQVPGIDILFNDYTESVNAQFGNIRAVKELSSVANQFDRKRTLAEMYGGSGWDLSFETMKRYGDWAYVMGVNTMNQHLSYMDVHGERKHDWPLSFSYHTPWWEHYKVLNNYYARLSLALSSGKQENKILVIEPTSTTWVYSTISSNENLKRQQIGNKFQHFLNKLEKNHYEFDLGCENIIKDYGKIIDGQFVINKRSYDLVIFPPGIENLDRNTFILIKEYLKQGGRILSMVDIPSYIEGELSEQMATLAYEHKTQYILANSCKEAVEKVKYTCNEYVPININEWGGNLYHHRRKLTDGQILFLANTDSIEGSNGKIKMLGKSVQELDLFSGKISSYASVRDSNNVKFCFNIPPSGSLLLYVSSNENNDKVSKIISGTYNRLNPVSSSVVERLDENVLTLDYCDLTIEKRTEKELLFFNASDKAYKHYGFKEGNPWCVSVQYKNSTVSRNKFKKGTGFKATYHFNVSKDYNVPSSIRVVIEQPNIWNVSINDHKVKHEKGKWWLDRSFGVYRIGRYIKPGINSISVSVNPMSVYAEIQPIYITGDFGLEPKEKGFEIVSSQELRIGSWKDQNLPLYGKRVSYRSVYNLRKDNKYVLRLNDWQGSVVQVDVNRQKVGIVAFPPYEIDISEFVTEGHNNIKVTVYGSLKNTLGPHHNIMRRNYTSPWSWRYAPEIQPPGNEYDVYDYGLFEDFSIFLIK